MAGYEPTYEEKHPHMAEPWQPTGLLKWPRMVRDFPQPFASIYRIVGKGDGFEAQDSEGGRIMDLTYSSGMMLAREYGVKIGPPTPEGE